MGFIVKLVLVLAVAALGVWGWMTFWPAAPAPVQEVQETAPAPVVQEPKTPGDAITASGSSDASLQADLQTLDAEVRSAENESVAVEESFSDKPVQQTE